MEQNAQQIIGVTVTDTTVDHTAVASAVARHVDELFTNALNVASAADEFAAGMRRHLAALAGKRLNDRERRGAQAEGAALNGSVQYANAARQVARDVILLADTLATVLPDVEFSPSVQAMFSHILRGETLRGNREVFDQAPEAVREFITAEMATGQRHRRHPDYQPGPHMSSRSMFRVRANLDFLGQLRGLDGLTLDIGPSVIGQVAAVLDGFARHEEALRGARQRARPVESELDRQVARIMLRHRHGDHTLGNLRARLLDIAHLATASQLVRAQEALGEHFRANFADFVTVPAEDSGRLGYVLGDLFGPGNEKRVKDLLDIKVATAEVDGKNTKHSVALSQLRAEAHRARKIAGLPTTTYKGPTTLMGEGGMLSSTRLVSDARRAFIVGQPDSTRIDTLVQPAEREVVELIALAAQRYPHDLVLGDVRSLSLARIVDVIGPDPLLVSGAIDFLQRIGGPFQHERSEISAATSEAVTAAGVALDMPLRQAMVLAGDRVPQRQGEADSYVTITRRITGLDGPSLGDFLGLDPELVVLVGGFGGLRRQGYSEFVDALQLKSLRAGRQRQATRPVGPSRPVGRPAGRRRAAVEPVVEAPAQVEPVGAEAAVAGQASADVASLAPADNEAVTADVPGEDESAVLVDDARVELAQRLTRAVQAPVKSIDGEDLGSWSTPEILRAIDANGSDVHQVLQLVERAGGPFVPPRAVPTTFDPVALTMLDLAEDSPISSVRSLITGRRIDVDAARIDRAMGFVGRLIPAATGRVRDIGGVTAYELMLSDIDPLDRSEFIRLQRLLGYRAAPAPDRSRDIAAVSPHVPTIADETFLAEVVTARDSGPLRRRLAKAIGIDFGTFTVGDVRRYSAAELAEIAAVQPNERHILRSIVAAAGGVRPPRAHPRDIAISALIDDRALGEAAPELSPRTVELITDYLTFVGGGQNNGTRAFAGLTAPELEMLAEGSERRLRQMLDAYCSLTGTDPLPGTDVARDSEAISRKAAALLWRRLDRTRGNIDALVLAGNIMSEAEGETFEAEQLIELTERAAAAVAELETFGEYVDLSADSEQDLVDVAVAIDAHAVEADALLTEFGAIVVSLPRPTVQALATRMQHGSADRPALLPVAQRSTAVRGALKAIGFSVPAARDRGPDDGPAAGPSVASRPTAPKLPTGAGAATGQPGREQRSVAGVRVAPADAAAQERRSEEARLLADELDARLDLLADALVRGSVQAGDDVSHVRQQLGSDEVAVTSTGDITPVDRLLRVVQRVDRVVDVVDHVSSAACGRVVTRSRDDAPLQDALGVVTPVAQAVGGRAGAEPTTSLPAPHPDVVEARRQFADKALLASDAQAAEVDGHIAAISRVATSPQHAGVVGRATANLEPGDVVARVVAVAQSGSSFGPTSPQDMQAYRGASVPKPDVVSRAREVCAESPPAVDAAADVEDRLRSAEAAVAVGRSQDASATATGARPRIARLAVEDFPAMERDHLLGSMQRADRAADPDQPSFRGLVESARSAQPHTQRELVEAPVSGIPADASGRPAALSGASGASSTRPATSPVSGAPASAPVRVAPSPHGLTPLARSAR